MEGRKTTMAEIGRALEGRSLGPYRLDKFVGGGGMGAVFRALDTTLDRIVAVKVLSRQQSGDEEMLKRFRNEAQSAARLDHENIGRVHAVGADDGWHYIVFEFIEGTNLRDVIAAGGPFDVARAIDVTIQVADALEHASQRNVVHRDIKPSNIIITPGGRARIVDMGLARLHHMAGDQDLTVSGMTLGTFDYISPEQARDPRSADVRSDLYSLGCTVYYMLAGRAPFAEGTMVQKLLQHQQDRPPAIESLRPDVPRRFGQIIGRLMEKDPRHRYQRPADLVADLVAMAADLGIELASPRTVSGPAPGAGPSRVPAHLPWLVPLLGLAAVVGGLWWRGTTAVRQPADGGSPDAGGAAAIAPVAGVDAPGQAGGTAPVAAAVAASAPRVWRVVDAPAVDDDCASVGEAVRQASDGDIVEIACEEPVDDGPLLIEDKRLTIRAADGVQPTLRFGEGGSLPRDGSCFTIDSGAVELQGLTLRMAFLAGGSGRPAFVLLRGASTLSCDRVSFVLPGDPATTGVCVRSEQSDQTRQEVRAAGTRVEGAAAFLEARGGGRIDLFWSGGRVVTRGRFLIAEGAARSVGAGPAIRLTLEEGLFACGDGFACLLDGPALPLPPRLQAFAKACRFLVPAGRALIDQTGIGHPEGYRTSVEWIDAGSRYEGSGILRRIDGAAERFEIDFGSQPRPLNHSATIEAWPDAD